MEIFVIISLKIIVKKIKFFYLKILQSHGSYYKKKKKVKFWGDAAIFSFYPAKNLVHYLMEAALLQIKKRYTKNAFY